MADEQQDSAEQKPTQLPESPNVAVANDIVDNNFNKVKTKIISPLKVLRMTTSPPGTYPHNKTLLTKYNQVLIVGP